MNVPGKLGAKPYIHNPQTLRFANYVERHRVPAPRERTNWLAAVERTIGVPDPYGFMLNNVWGCCTISGIGHHVQVTTANAQGRTVTVPDAAILKGYCDVSELNPMTGENDNGATLLDALRYWRAVGIGGHRCGAYALVDLRDVWLVKHAIDWHGPLYVAASLPDDLDADSGLWVVGGAHGPTEASKPDPERGHCFIVVAHEPRGVWILSWGRVYLVSWFWVDVYLTEAWVVLSDDWINGKGVAPSGEDRASLIADLRVVTGGR